MKRMRIVGLALVALVAMGIASASASAEPVFFGKAEIGGTVGHVAFTGTGGTAFLEGKTSKLKIECKAETAAGEVTGPTSTAKNITKFTSCEVATLALPCESTGAAAKEIVTNALIGELGGVTASLPGIRLKPESGIYLAEFQCAGGGVLVKVKGSVIGSLSGATATTVEAGKLATSMKLTLAQTGGKQKYQKFLTGGEEQLTSVVSEFNSEKGEYVTHEELGGQSAIVTLKTTPAGQLGVTK
jgi:hypothetical protein